MSQLKPFLFWIVIGVILFLELLYWVLSLPDVDLLGNKAEAQKMQASLKTEYQHLQELSRRAKNTSPPGVFDAEKESDIKRLTDDYLITPAWKSVLDPHVASYDKQLKAIKERLANRSKSLHEPIAANSDKFGWYSAYQNATEEQLKRLHAAGALAVKRTAGSSPAPAMPGKPPGAMPAKTTVEPASDERQTLDFANDSALRATAGFYTKGANLPEPAEYPTLTKQYRTMERIISVILDTSVANSVNPLIPTESTSEPAHAAIANVAWVTTDTEIGGETAKYAVGWRLSLTLRGPLTALLATTAALEHPHGDQVPLFVVTGGEFGRKPTFIAGERKDVGTEEATARIDLLVLDFTDAPTGLKPSAAAAAKAKTPIGPGFPGGMSPGMGFPPGMPPGAGGPPGMAPTAPPKVAPRSIRPAGREAVEAGDQL